MPVNFDQYQIKPSGYSYSKGTPGNPQIPTSTGSQGIAGDPAITQNAVEPYFTSKPSWMTDEEWRQYLAQYGRTPESMMGAAPTAMPSFNYAEGIGSQVYGGGTSYGSAPQGGNFDMSAALKAFGG